MPFDWPSIVMTTKRLPKNSTRREPTRRRNAPPSAASHAVFNQAYDYLRRQGFERRVGEGMHKQVWDEYRKGHRTRKAIGTNGSRLHDNRVAVDYQAEVPKLPELLTESFRTAANLLAYLAQLQQEESRHCARQGGAAAKQRAAGGLRGRGGQLRCLLLQPHPQQPGQQQDLKLKSNPPLAQVDQVQRTKPVFPSPEEQFNLPTPAIQADDLRRAQIKAIGDRQEVMRAAAKTDQPQHCLSIHRGSIE